MKTQIKDFHELRGVRRLFVITLGIACLLVIGMVTLVRCAYLCGLVYYAN